MAGNRKAATTPDGVLGSWRAKRAERKATRKERPKTWKTRVLAFFKWTLVTGLVLVLLAVAGFVYLYKTTDIPKPNAEFLTETSFVYYDDGDTELGRFATQFRDSISYDEMPDTVKDAVVAAENRTFFTDNGIDVKGILRAAFSNARGNSTQGASTITQQYVKVLYLTQERSYKRKIKEAILSLKIQREQSKQQVLEGYLNTIYFGRGAYGIQAAADAYFGRQAKNLNLRQSAVLAAVLNNPSGFDPANGSAARKNLRERYDYVLDSMLELEDITTAEHDTAIRKLPDFPEIEAESTYGGQRGHLLTMVKDELLKLKDKDGNPFTEQEIDGGGLRVTTTFTEKAMESAEQGVLAERPDGFSDKRLHIGVATVEPGTGAVRGIYAGQDYLESQLNWAVAGGQAGSTFKPFALAAGIKDGYSLRDPFDGNSPYETPDGIDFENEGDTDYGTVSMLTATEKSINTAYIDLTSSMENGPQKIIDMANAMGIPPEKAKKKDAFGFPDETPGLEPITGVSLGSQTVSPINMANAYATIANGGQAAEPYIIEKVVDADGETVYEHKVANDRAVSSDIASDVSYALQETVAVGTGNNAGATLGRPAAGKTGTATNGNDEVSSAWFVGFTPQLSTAVMYVRGKGNEQLKGWLPSYFGGDYPARTWGEVMRLDLDGVPEEEFPEPAYVDGEAPDSDHEYVEPPPPPPPPSTTRRPPRTPTQEPTTDEPTSEPPATSDPPETSEPPATSEPPEPTQTPTCTITDPCGPVTGGGQPSGQPSGQSAPRMAPMAFTTRETTSWWVPLMRSVLGLSA